MSLLGGVWQSTTISGTPARSGVSGEAGHPGIVRHTLTDNPSGVVLATPTKVQGNLPVGMLWQVTLRLLDGTSSCEWWSGFASAAARVSTGTVDFVGVRWDGSDLKGVCRSGTSESTVSLGAPSVGTWVTVTFTRTAAGVVFALLDASDRALLEVETAGTVASNIPSGPLYWVAIGGYSTTTDDRTCDIDAWGVGGRTAR